MKFKAIILQTGNNTGIPITEEILEKLGGGKKPLIVVTVNGYSYRSAVGKMGDRYMISLSAENRNKANVKGGDTVEVSITLDTEQRIIEVPNDLQYALDANKIAKINFEKLAPSKKKAMVLSTMEAKSEETRMRRIAKAIEVLG